MMRAVEIIFGRVARVTHHEHHVGGSEHAKSARERLRHVVRDRDAAGTHAHCVTSLQSGPQSQISASADPDRLGRLDLGSGRNAPLDGDDPVVTAIVALAQIELIADLEPQQGTAHRRLE